MFQRAPKAVMERTPGASLGRTVPVLEDSSADPAGRAAVLVHKVLARRRSLAAERMVPDCTRAVRTVADRSFEQLLEAAGVPDPLVAAVRRQLRPTLPRSDLRRLWE